MLSESNMDALIRLKIQFDLVTGRISEFCMRKPIRIFLKTLKWLAISFLVFDSYIYSVTTGNTTLFTTIVIVLSTSFLTRKKSCEEEQVSAELLNRPATKPGMKSACEKCGAKVTINYGDAYHTLCDKCT